MSDKELKLQVELLQKQNEELKESNRKLREQIVVLTEQIKESKFEKDVDQAISIANRRRNSLLNKEI